MQAHFSVRKELLRQRRFRWMLIALFVISLLLGLIIVPIEAAAGGTINNPLDGLWWAISTITTVGYGDFVPISPLGKLIGMILQLLGATMFGILIAVMSNAMNRGQEEFYWNRLFERINLIETELAEIKRRTAYLVKDKAE